MEIYVKIALNMNNETDKEGEELSGIVAEGRKPKNIKNDNLRYVLTIVKNHKVCTAGEISKESRLSVTTINKILDHLKRVGLVKCLGKGQSTKEGGKKPELFAFNERFQCAVNIFFGPSRAVCVITDLYSETLMKCECVYSDKDDLDSCNREVYQSLLKLLEDSGFGREDVCGISIGIAGIVNVETGNVVYPIHNLKWGSGDGIIKKCREVFADNTNIMVENAGRLRAQYVFCKNPELRYKSVAVLTSNINNSSGAIFKNGLVLHGSNGLLGEFGHIVIPDSKRVLHCECGKVNCFERLVDMEMLPEYAKEVICAEEDPQWYRRLYDGEAAPVEIIRMADAGSRTCQKVLDIIIDYYIIVIQNLMLTCDTECYVFGGVYVENSQYFCRELLRKFRENHFLGMEFKPDVRFLDLSEYDFSGSTLAVIDHYLQHLNFDS